MVKNCYIHIPFCQRICSYCDFCKLLYNDRLIDSYLDSLEREINEIYQGEELETIYIGGGTPSCLSLNQLERLLKIVDKLNKSKDVEYTIEGNFNTTTNEKLDLYKKHHINRLSLGIESIDKNNLLFLERDLDVNSIKQRINIFREKGFNNINVDLMYALPRETLEVLEKDLDFILSLNVEHISTYSLIIEPHTKISINNTKPIAEELDEEMYNLIRNKLKANGYQHYEISNFSKEGYSSKHNLCYWKNKNYYGFGLGASSYIDNKRVENTRSITKYNNDMYIKEIEILTKEDTIEYEIILNLRMMQGIDLLEFKKKYDKELKELYDYQQLVYLKLLTEKNDRLFISEDKIYVSNEIIVRILNNKI